MDCCKHLTITPISKDAKSASNIDYNEQLVRVKTNELKWCWDDSRYNKAKENEYFAFYFHGNRVVIHKIRSVKPPSCRLSSWSKNVGQGDRNVLELSEPLKEIGWTEWQLLNGPESKMGTYTTDNLKSDRPLLYQMLLNIERNIDNPKNIRLIIEDNNEENLEEEEENLLKRLSKIKKIKKIKTLEHLKNKMLENIRELNEQILQIDEEIISIKNLHP
jgi:hypothetical protein